MERAPMKPMSWTQAGLLMAVMAGGFLGFSSMLAPVHRQLGSLHSDFWRVAVPYTLVTVGTLVLIIRFIINRMAAQQNRTSS